ncbi:Putative transporter [Tolypocladium paradoxum]|uniref:Transporter n=1 Tax=Tolypocladium paradoxum TaxID=94208 RepID=A0A2S4KQP6_9HYPO|nr:Putative transporter [Tolypocladium paradoxum]
MVSVCVRGFSRIHTKGSGAVTVAPTRFSSHSRVARKKMPAKDGTAEFCQPEAARWHNSRCRRRPEAALPTLRKQGRGMARNTREEFRAPRRPSSNAVLGHHVALEFSRPVKPGPGAARGARVLCRIPSHAAAVKHAHSAREPSLCLTLSVLWASCRPAMLPRTTVHSWLQRDSSWVCQRPWLPLCGSRESPYQLALSRHHSSPEQCSSCPHGDTRAELPRRIAWFFCGNALAEIFGGLSAVLKNLHGASGIAGWRWLFIVEGVTTVGLSFVAVFFLPDYAAMTHETSDTNIWNGIMFALLYYRLYLFVSLTHMTILAMKFQYFPPSIVQTLALIRSSRWF